LHKPNSPWGQAGKRPEMPWTAYWYIVQDTATKTMHAALGSDLQDAPPEGVIRFRSEKGALLAIAKMEKKNGTR
jgi:hypothetical protein